MPRPHLMTQALFLRMLSPLCAPMCSECQSTTEGASTASSDRDESAAVAHEGDLTSWRHPRTSRGIWVSQNHAQAVEKLTYESFTRGRAQGMRGELAQNKASLWTHVMRACTGAFFASPAAARRRRRQPLGHLRPPSRSRCCAGRSSVDLRDRCSCLACRVGLVWA